MRTIEINGKDFNSLEGFYKFLEPFLAEGECPWGRNLDSLDEVVFNKFNYTPDTAKDVRKIIWDSFAKSESELNDKRGDQLVINILEEILNSNKEIEFIKR